MERDKVADIVFNMSRNSMGSVITDSNMGRRGQWFFYVNRQGRVTGYNGGDEAEAIRSLEEMNSDTELYSISVKRLK